MQLKSLGNLSFATEAIKKLPNDFINVSNAVKTLSKDQVAAALTSSTLTNAQKTQILISSGLTAEEVKVALATGTLSVSQKGATASTLGLSSAFKGLWTVIATNPLTIPLVAIGALAIAFKNYEERAERAKQKNQENADSYNQLKSEIESLNSELNTTDARLKELNSKESLTLIEEEEKERLTKTNDELERTLRIKQALANVQATELAKSSNEVLTTQSEKSIENYTTTRDGMSYAQDVDQIDSLNEYLNLAERQKQSLQEAQNALSEYESSYEGTMETMVQDDKWKRLTEQIKYYEGAITETEATVSKKYSEIESSSENLVDSTGKVVEGCESTHERIVAVTKRVDDYFADTADKASEAAEEVSESINSIPEPFSKTEMISAINGLSEGFEELDKIYESISDKNPFDFKLLDDKNFKETFSGLGKEYSDFIETVSSSPDDINACKDAFNNLVSAWIDSTGILDKVDEGNAKVTASMLKMMGVENAEEIVTAAVARNHENLAAQKWLNANATIDLNKATASEIQQLIDEGVYAGQAEGALIKLVAEKIISNSTPLSTNGDIENLKALALQAGATADAIAFIKTGIDGVAGSAGAGAGRLYSNNPEKAKSKLKGVIDKAVNANYGTGTELNTPVYSGGNKSNTSSGSGGSSGSGSETSGQEEYYDWLSTALEKAASQNDKIREQVDDENNSYSERLSLQQQLLANNQQELELLKIANQRRVEGWEAAKQKILETFGEIEGNQLIQNIMSGNSKEGEWFSNIVGDEKKKVVDDAIQANKDLEESNDEITEKEKENAEDIQKEFEMRKNEIKSFISEVETAMDSIQSSMSIRETSGSEIITEADYRSLIRQSKEQISLYEEQLDVLYEQRDSLEENSAEWYGIQSEIASVEASINDCKEAQAEWNEEIKKLPVKRIERYLELLENIKKDITNFQAEQDVLGISSTKEQLQELISISEQQIKKLLEQHALLTKNLDTYTYGTDKFNECSNEIQAVEDNISELIQQMREYNNQILQIPINRISELNEKLNNIKDAMSAVSDDYDTTVNTVVDAIDHQIDSLNDLIKAEEDAAEAKIKPLQDQLDLLEKQNEAREVQLGLEQAQWDLERAKNQKTNKVVRDGEIQYEADQSKVRDAEQNLADKQLEKTKWEIQTQIDSIEEARDKMIDGYNTEIDRLTEISKKWEEIKHNIEDSMNAATTTEIIGDGWLNSVLSGNDQDIFDKFVKEFTDIETQKALYEKQIQENERVSALMQQYITAFNNGSMSYEEVIKQFNALQNAAKDGFSSKEYLDAQLGITGSKDTSTAIKDVQDDVLKSYSDFRSYLDVVNKNSNTIASYTSTWEQIRDAVVEQLEVLKKLAEEEAKKVAAATSSSSSGRKSSGGGSGTRWDSRDENNGPGAEINAKKANGTYSSSSSSSSSSPSGPASDPDLKKKKNRSSYKVGIENGFVGENNTSVGDMIKILALEKLDPDEIPVIAHKREGIFNQEQMETIVGNFKTALFSPTVKTVGTPTIVKQPTNINIEMGDFNLPNVKNGEEFAAYLKQNFALLMKQEISKAFK